MKHTPSVNLRGNCFHKWTAISRYKWLLLYTRMYIEPATVDWIIKKKEDDDAHALSNIQPACKLWPKPLAFTQSKIKLKDVSDNTFHKQSEPEMMIE